MNTLLKVVDQERSGCSPTKPSNSNLNNRASNASSKPLENISFNGRAVEPFLHFEPQSIYNPLTDLRLRADESGFQSLITVAKDITRLPTLPKEEQQRLDEEGWLVAAETDLSRRFRLKYVQIETNTTCNHSCHFCPVSVSPRETYAMPTEVFQSIMDQLTPFKSTLEGVWLHHYNEPTTDKRLVQFVQYMWEKGLTPCMNSNASGLTPRKVEDLMKVGGLGSLTINLSTIDPEKYRAERGVDQLHLVLKNLNHLKNIRLAPRMHIVVIGSGDEAEQQEFERISALFEGSCFEVYHYAHNNRGDRIGTGLSGDIPEGPLGGCDFKGSRPLQHLTIDAYANVVLCCQDYHSDYSTGNLATEPLLDILEGDRMKRLKNWVYGLEVPDADFICRKCHFALPSKESTINELKA